MRGSYRGCQSYFGTVPNTDVAEATHTLYTEPANPHNQPEGERPDAGAMELLSARRAVRDPGAGDKETKL
jgi:hypothetical protein